MEGKRGLLYWEEGAPVLSVILREHEPWKEEKKKEGCRPKEKGKHSPKRMGVVREIGGGEKEKRGLLH